MPLHDFATRKDILQKDLITSRDNPLFKRLKKLAESARARRETHTTLLDGEHLITSYLEAGGMPLTLMHASSCSPAVWQSLAGRCGGARVVEFSDSLFAELSPVETPFGVMAEAAWLDALSGNAVPLVLLLEDIQDPGNMGSLLRSAAAAGATLAVLSKGCTDAWSPKALRGGQGAQFVLPMLLRADLLSWVQSADLPVWALALGGDQSLYQVDLAGPTGFLVGNEGAGLSGEILQAAKTVLIPMPGRVESLNAAAAATIALFEAVRQRNLVVNRS
jgi:TrmH family RNA methyltransferase